MTKELATARVFISYARSDGEDVATKLRTRLEQEHPEIALWQDRVRMEGGVSWWKQISEALETVEYLVLVMTPAALSSETCRREWWLARQQGVCVYPVKGLIDDRLDYSILPRWMRKAHFYDLEREWDLFVNGLKRPCHVGRVPFMAPDLPYGLVERSQLFNQVLALLMSPDRKEPLVLTTAIRGAGGLGKTTVAAAVCHDEDVISTFDDGILWVTLGERPQIQQALTKLYAALTGERPAFVDEEDAAFHLGERLEDRTCLIVIDDVWNPAHLSSFLRGGPGCARLITTRFFDVASDDRRVEVGEMTASESLCMLTKRVRELPADLSPICDLADRLDRWPLLLELAGSALANRVARGDTVKNALVYVSRKLDKQGVVAFDHHDPTKRNQAISKTIEVSLEMVGETERQRLSELSVFPEDTGIPLEIVTGLWAIDSLDTEELVERFENLALLKFSPQLKELRLHDLIRHYLSKNVEDMAKLHGRLVDTIGLSPQSLCDYGIRWLPLHLARAGRMVELRALITSIEWLRTKAEKSDASMLLDDFDWFPHDPELQDIREALALSAHVFSQDPAQLVSQLLARLPTRGNLTAAFRYEWAKWDREPWLNPLRRLLTTPGSPLRSTFVGHSGRVRAVQFLPDGSRVVSAGDDTIVRVWDVERAVLSAELIGHTDWIRAVCIFPDGRLVVSVSDDHTIRIWDLETYQLVQIIETEYQWLRVAAVTANGRHIVSAADDNLANFWDWKIGRRTRSFVGHEAKINAISTLRDGRILTASDDRTVRLWHEDKEAELAVLTGHTGRVQALALFPDDSSCITVGSDSTMRVWDLQGDSLGYSRVITKKAQWVRGLAVTADCRRAIAACEDREIEVWEIESGSRIASLKGHTDWVGAVAVSNDGRYAISGSDDHTLKLWNLHVTRQRSAEPLRHFGRVREVLCLPGGKWVISAGNDSRLILWSQGMDEAERMVDGLDVHRIAALPFSKCFVSIEADAAVRVRCVEDFSERCVFRRHADQVRAIAVSPDGGFVCSVGDDRVIRRWNANSGAEHGTIPVGTQIRSLAIMTDGQHLVSGAVRGRIKVLSIETGQIVADLDGHAAQVNSLRITADGGHLLSASDDHTIRVWDLKRMTCASVIEGHTGRVRGVDMNAEGSSIVSVADDATVRFWNSETCSPVTVFTGESPFLCVSHSTERNLVVAGDRSGHVHFFEKKGKR